MKRRALLKASAAWGLAQSTQASAADDGRALRIAIISPNTGALAAFGATNIYVHELFAQRLAQGLDTRHMGRRKIELELHDAASSSERAAEIASALAASGVHMVLASATPEICNPVADVCEAAGIPCVTTVAPWQAWFQGRKGDLYKGFQWTFHFFVGLEDFADVHSSLFARARLGSLVGGIWPDDIDGSAFMAAFPRAMEQRGLRLFEPGRLKLSAPDYKGIATRLRDARVSMVTGVLPPPMALAFHAAAREVGYQPRMLSLAKAFAFADTVGQIDQPDLALTNEVWWSPAWPFSSGFTSASSAQVAREYETRTGKPWVQTLGFSHAMVDLAVQAVEQAQEPTRQGLVQALRRVKARTVVGPLSFSGRMPSLNVCSTPAVGGQWLKNAQGRWVLEVVDNTRSPFIPVTAELTLGQT